MKKRKIYYYFVLLPVAGVYVFSDKEKPEISIHFKRDSECEFDLEFFTKSENQSQISHFRITFKLDEEQALSENEFEIVQDVKEYSLGLLRIMYSPFTMLHPFSPSFEEGVSVSMQFPSVFNEPNFNVHVFRDVLAHGLPFKEDVILLSDSYNRYLSSIYQFLSLFKIFEKKGKNKDKTIELVKKHSRKYREDFAALSITKLHFENFVWDLRAKCAHMVSNNEGKGLRANVNADMIMIGKFLPIFQQMCVDLINETMKEVSKVDLRLIWKHPPGWENIPRVTK